MYKWQFMHSKPGEIFQLVSFSINFETYFYN